jgi:HSP20 family protein
MNRLFDEVSRGFGLPAGGLVGSTGWPIVDVAETEKEIRVTAELPGLTEKDVEIVLNDDVLTLKGERKAEKDGEKDGVVFSERFFGRFQRMIPLAAEVDRDKVSASMKDGVLNIVLPKSATAKEKAKRIPIGSK